MAFFVYKQPVNPMMEYFGQPIIRCQRKRRIQDPYFIINKIFDQKMENSAKMTKKDADNPLENSNQDCKEIKTQNTQSKLASRFKIDEDLKKMEITLELFGYEFEPENFDIQVLNDTVLVVKAEKEEKSFEKKFTLPKNCDFEKIDCKIKPFDEENKQIIVISVPKKVKCVQIPISMVE